MGHEKSPGQSEKEPLPVTVGDIVTFPREVKPASSHRNFLVVDRDVQYGNIEAMPIPMSSDQQWTLPGTERIIDVAEIVGHYDAPQIVDALLSAIYGSLDVSSDIRRTIEARVAGRL